MPFGQGSTGVWSVLRALRALITYPRRGFSPDELARRANESGSYLRLGPEGVILLFLHHPSGGAYAWGVGLARLGLRPRLANPPSVGYVPWPGLAT